MGNISIQNRQSQIKNQKSKISSFTLIELIVVIAILSIISVITINYVINATSMYVQISGQSEVDEEAVAALNRIRREIRTLQTTVIADSNTLSFINHDNKTNTFQLSGTEVTLNDRVLAMDVDKFLLTYYNKTNGSLALPVTNMALINRVAIDFRIANKNQSADLNVNLFYPRQGILK